MFSSRSAIDRTRNRLDRARSAALAQGRALLDLTESNPTRAGLRAPASLLQALAHPDAAGYEPDPFGLPSARAAVSAFMRAQGIAIAPEHIVLSASTSEAYAFLFKLLCDPGDDVLVPSPSYPLFEHLAQLEAIAVRPYPLEYDGRWHVPGDALARAVGPRTRAVIAVHPNNPTGSFLKRDELAQLAALGLPIISDEVFAGYAFEPDPARVQTALHAPQVLSFALHGLSKLAGLPQLKLAWTCVGGPEALVEEALSRLELIADSFLSVSTPVQLALPRLLEGHGALQAAIAARTRSNLAHVRDALAGSAVSVLHVEGGWYAIARLPAVLDDEGWALALLEQHALLVQPGYFYDLHGGPYVVLSLLAEEAAVREGVTRLRACVAAQIE